ncbi:MAG: hypothetical protein IKR71_09600 [Bacteroidales bacterium]|nr:hypothetical protein [Bacteroidales bacterium]
MFKLIFNIPNISVVIFGGIAWWWCNREYTKTKSRPLLNCLSGVFTSLGLLGTFFSICYSLYGLEGVDAQTVENTGKTLAEVRAAGSQGLNILKIISKLIPAFTSSIIGLLGALIVTVWAKKKFADEEVEENSRLGNASPEEYIRDIAIYSKEMTYNKSIFNKHNELLSELINLYKDQEQKNKEYSDKLNDNISHQSEILKEFIDGFVKRMDDIFKQMHGAIQQQVQNFGEEQFSKTSQLLASITERLSNVSNEIINNQRQSVETMMNNTNTEIVNITTSVTEVLGNLTSKVQESLANLNTQQSERLNAIISNYDSLATKLSEQNTDFASKVTEQMQAEYSKVQEHNVQSLQQMVDLRTAYQEITSDVLTSTLAMNEKATTDMRESMSGFVSNIQTLIATQCSTLSTAISTNVESLNKAYQFIESLVAEIRQNYDQAVLAYGDAVNVAHRTNESSEKLIAANNTSLQAVEVTNNKISEILDVLVDRQENIEQLTKQISSVSGAIVELQKLESTLNKITNSK